MYKQKPNDSRSTKGALHKSKHRKVCCLYASLPCLQISPTINMYTLKFLLEGQVDSRMRGFWVTKRQGALLSDSV